MTEEEEDSNAPDKIIFRQDPNEFECASKIDEIEIDDRYSYKNTFLNLDDEIQFIFGGNDSLLKRCENNINDFNNKNINIIQDKNLEKNLQLDKSKNNTDFKSFNDNFIFFDELEKDITSIYSKKNQIFMNIGANIRKKRKFMEDMIRKRIKSDFYRVIRKNLNSKINSKDINLEKIFDFPQTMITNVSKNHCKKNLNMTLKEILIFYYKTDNQEINSINLTISENNKSIILLLENKKIYELEYIFSMKIVDLYNEY